MKYMCLGYFDEAKFMSLSEGERTELMDACMAYDEELQKNGSWVSGEVAITDGPYAETKEQIGGVLYLEAVDLNHAIQIMSKHPGVKIGPFEIRPVADLQAIIQESRQRRAASESPSKN
jgi:hypothetical protein